MDKIFYGRQIRENFRGGLALVVTKDSKGRHSGFFYPICSEDFIHLTGIRSVTNPVKRAYIGISQTAGEELLRSFGELAVHGIGETELKILDFDVVLPYFLKQESS